MNQNTLPNNTHSKVMGYILWLFGFMGSHRFYYGKPVSGTIWMLTLGLFGVGWLIDIFLIPAMDEECDVRYYDGVLDYNIAWVLLTFLGVFGFHKFYQGKIIMGVLYLLTGGFFLFGILYDFWTLNEQIDEINKKGF